MKGYEKLEQHLIHQGKVVGFYEDIVKLPSGKVVTWDLVKHKGAAAVVPVISDDKQSPEEADRGDAGCRKMQNGQSL